MRKRYPKRAPKDLPRRRSNDPRRTLRNRSSDSITIHWEGTAFFGRKALRLVAQLRGKIWLNSLTNCLRSWFNCTSPWSDRHYCAPPSILGVRPSVSFPNAQTSHGLRIRPSESHVRYNPATFNSREKPKRCCAPE